MFYYYCLLILFVINEVNNQNFVDTTLQNTMQNDKNIYERKRTNYGFKLEYEYKTILKENHKGIFLLIVLTGKVYERVVQQRLRKWMKKQLEDKQSNFFLGCSIQDRIFTITQVRQVMKKVSEYNTKKYNIKHVPICGLGFKTNS